MDTLLDRGVIAAVSTPRGTGGVAMLRLSGQGVFDVCDRFVSLASYPSVADAPTAKLCRAAFSSEGEVIDDGLVAVFHAPHSYTGEDTVELYCHGGVLLTETLLAAALQSGAKAAEGGEFTKRAFLNGKLSLTEAEAVISAIHAETKDALRLSQAQRGGVLSGALSSLSERCESLLAAMYVSIDYPEEDLSPLTDEELSSSLASLCDAVKGLLDGFHVGHAVTEGVDTVLVGRPNVGKSSLLNALLGEERAIVTEQAGTTRDTVEARCVLGGILLRLCDTAGIREADGIEGLGVARARKRLGEAELILAVFDGALPPTEEDLSLRQLLAEQAGRGATVLAVCNKSDLGQNEQMGRFLETLPSALAPLTLSASCPDGARKVLSEAISTLYRTERLDPAAPILTNARQYAALSEGYKSLLRASEQLLAGQERSLVGLDLEAFLSAVAETDGRGVSEAVVHRIFSRFCVGK